MLGSESWSKVVMSPNGDAEEREEVPKGDAGFAAASPAIGGGALALGLALGAESPPARSWNMESITTEETYSCR